MREILFRGKRVDNGEWVYGSFIPDLCELLYGNKLDGFIKPFGKTRKERLMVEVDRKTVGQYTGLRDKNSTRIFEADIVKVYDVYCNETVVGVVEFCDGSFRIYDKDFTSYDRWMYCKVEVIGNVFDNPELLEGEQ